MLKPESLAILNTLELIGDANVRNLVQELRELESSVSDRKSSRKLSEILTYAVSSCNGLHFLRFVPMNPTLGCGYHIEEDYVIPVLGGSFIGHNWLDRDTASESVRNPYVLYWHGNDNSSYYRRFLNEAKAQEFLVKHPFFDPTDKGLYTGHNS
jgi:hypothetical protein